LKYSKNTANSQKLGWDARFEAKEDKNEVIKELTANMKKCNELNKLQDELVQKARVWLYSDQSDHIK
jgi:hypothetical protein